MYLSERFAGLRVWKKTGGKTDIEKTCLCNGRRIARESESTQRASTWCQKTDTVDINGGKENGGKEASLETYHAG